MPGRRDPQQPRYDSFSRFPYKVSFKVSLSSTKLLDPRQLTKTASPGYVPSGFRSKEISDEQKSGIDLGQRSRSAVDISSAVICDFHSGVPIMKAPHMLVLVLTI